MNNSPWKPMAALVAAIFLPSNHEGVLSTVDDVATLRNVSVDADQPVLVVDGRRSSGCVEDETYEYTTAGISLGDLRTPSTSTAECYAEAAVFSRNHAAWLGPDYSWTSDDDDLSISLSSPLALTLKIRIVSNEAGAGQDDRLRAEADVELAATLLNDNRVGVAIGSVITKITPGSAKANVIGDGCLQTDELRASTDPTVYSPTMLNVYYVPTIKMPDEFDLVGYTCFEHGAANIIFVSLSAPAGSVLAHELGHAFSLRYDNGHVPKSTFGATNLMRGDMDVDAWEAAETFRLGQAYRMNFDGASWLNLSGARAGATRFCQDRRNDSWPCPKLSLAFP